MGESTDGIPQDELQTTNDKVEDIGSELKHVKALLVSALLILQPCAGI
jgi:hypothetical protein